MMASPLSGDWPVEARAALLDELLHQLDWRSGSIPFDAAAFASPEARVAFLIGAARQLINTCALPVSEQELKSHRKTLNRAGEHSATAEADVEDVQEKLAELVTQLNDDLKEQARSPHDVVQSTIGTLKGLHDKLVGARESIDKSNRELFDLDEALA